MIYRQDTVFSLVLSPDPEGFRDRDLRGFFLFMLEIFSKDYRQKNPLKYHVLPFLFEVASNVH